MFEELFVVAHVGGGCSRAIFSGCEFFFQWVEPDVWVCFDFFSFEEFEERGYLLAWDCPVFFVWMPSVAGYGLYFFYVLRVIWKPDDNLLPSACPCLYGYLPSHCGVNCFLVYNSFFMACLVVVRDVGISISTTSFFPAL